MHIFSLINQRYAPILMTGSEGFNKLAAMDSLEFYTDLRICLFFLYINRLSVDTHIQVQRHYYSYEYDHVGLLVDLLLVFCRALFDGSEELNFLALSGRGHSHRRPLKPYCIYQKKLVISDFMVFSLN